MFLKRISTWILIQSLTWVLLLATSVQSQSITNSDQLDDSERATIMFDFKLNRIRDHEMLKDFPLKEVMNQVQVPPSPAMDLQKLNRIFGGSQLPDDPAAMQAQPGNPVDYEFFVRMEFADSSAADATLQFYRDQGGSEVQIDGKSYWKPQNEMTPPNLKIHRVNPITIEMATDRYAFHPDRNVISAPLAEQWKAIPRQAALRFCADLQGNRPVVNQLVEQMRTDVPPSVQPFLELINELAVLSLAVDLNSNTLVLLQASSDSDEGAEKLRAGLDGVLGMGRLIGQQNLSQSSWDDETKQVFEALLSSLKAAQHGKTVRIEIAKPEGFADVVSRLIGQTGG